MLLIAVMAALVLTSALDNLRLQPGAPFPGPNRPTAQTESGAAARRVSVQEMLPALRGVLALSVLVLGLLLVRRLASVARLTDLIGPLLGMAAIILLLTKLPPLPAGAPIELPPEQSAPRVPSADYAKSPLGTPPPSFIWIGALLVLVGAAAALTVVVRPRRKPRNMATQLAADASRGLEAIQAGADVRSVVIRCYLQMTTLLQTERGISRERGMTVREFETQLERLELPVRPLLRLRSLFEAVRYGDREMTDREEQAAIDCLEEITTSLMTSGGA